MEKPIDELSKVILDRLKNPYIITFLISWVLFNWRPIAFFIFSKGTVEYKIDTIQICYTNVEHYFYYPLTSTLVFLFFLPFLNTFNEYCVQWTLKKRGEFLTDQIKNKIKSKEAIAIAEDKMHEAVRVEKEGQSRDEFIRKLEENYSTVQGELEEQRNLYLEQMSKYNEDTKTLNEKFNIQIDEYRKNIETLQNTITEKNTSEDFYENSIYTLKNTNQKLEENLQRLENRISDAENSANTNHADYSLFLRNIGLEGIKKDKLFMFDDGTRIIETFTDLNELYHYNALDNTMIDSVSFLEWINQISYKEVTLGQNKMYPYQIKDLPDEYQIKP